ncbi:MAG: hypothetical protein A2W91_13935 [Bacteroidetes bacterium GWF2_38_335]|nr:MAG: hypothetical protein A2W91_13935 [Bacteroidetes bacterium GWF2_38_335]OFY77852.1 MAG: hypothetical protein A2281_15625 [Bacteroidetes bacterium RIFOXYA12_FULL_38_20]
MVIKKKKDYEVTYKNGKFTVSGFIKDKTAGETLIGASVYAKETNTGTTTNEYGFYSLTLNAGEYYLVISFLGYEDLIIPLILDKNQTISRNLSIKSEYIQVVEVNAENENKLIEKSIIGEVEMKPSELKTIPGFMGEKDIIKSLQMIPGIKSYGDGSSFFYVRGGDRDQNLILIDDAPVFNPSHLLGFYTSFIPEATKDVKVYKGDLPVKYGGRLSSVLEIRTKDGNMNTISGSGSLGAFTSRITIEGPIKKEKSSFFTSYRRSNLNWLLNNSSNNTNIYFSDFNYKINFTLNSNNRLFFSGYNGNDEMMMDDNFGIKWKNNAFTLRWNHIFNDRLFSNTTLTTSSYNYFLIISEADTSYWNSSISNVSVKSDLTFFHNPGIKQTFGVFLGGYYFNPGEYIERSNPMNELRFGFSEYYTKNSAELGVYHGIEFEPAKNLNMNAGYRLTNWLNIGPATEYKYNNIYEVSGVKEYTSTSSYHSYGGFEPRISANYKLNGKSSVKAGYSRTLQYLQVLSNSISPFTSLEIWLPAGPYIQPQKANQYSAGYFRKIKNPALDVSAELFYKRMKNQIDYTDHANMLLNPYIEAELRFGTAFSYGLEIFVRKETGKLTGWFGYTYSKTRKTIKNINNDKPFAPFYDRPHDITLNLAYTLNKRWTFSASWVYSTGSAISLPIGFFNYQGITLPIYGEKNNARLPDYHRLDLAVVLNLNPKSEKRFKHNISLSLYNAYWRKNLFSINYNKLLLNDGSIVIPSDMYKASDLVPTSKYMTGILPAISYNLNF